MRRLKLVKGPTMFLAFLLSAATMQGVWAASSGTMPSTYSALVKIVKSAKGEAEKSEALAKLQDLAGNDPEAKRNLAELYLSGSGVTADVPKALALLEEAGTSGSAGALRRLSSIYQLGQLVPQDKSKALGPVDKVDSQISGSVIQDCFLGGSFGSRRPDGYGMADHRGAVAHRTR